MPKHRNGTALQCVLARIWGLRDAQTWTARGHSRDGRTASLRISFDQHGVTLTPSHPGELRFAPPQVGHIRAALRTAIEAIEEPGQAVRTMPPAGFDRQVRPTTWPPSPAPRATVVLDGSPSTKPRLDVNRLLARYPPEDHRDRQPDAVSEPRWPEQDSDDDGSVAA